MPNTERWKQRFDSFLFLFGKLLDITEKYQPDDLDDIIRDSLIKRFELTFELSWLVLKDFLESQGEANLYGSRNTFRTAFNRGLIRDGEDWMEIIESRVTAAHVYDEERAGEIVELIYDKYINLFRQLKSTMEEQSGN